ncbi:MAG: L-threonylcarbamoyladenylate synthase [Syntrophorhabdaceae bacterium]|nr:L-threonylcarbamoyladenylate synthase [Syntrophorhabdaceae bacterium]
MIIEWKPDRPKKKLTELLKETLLQGGIVVYPTDTLYGMGCDLFNIKAIRKLYQIKRLPEKRALSIICRDFKDISNYAHMSDFAFSIMRRHIPGPYTFVLKAKKIIPKLLMTEKKEVGIRIPDHPVPLGIANLIDKPLINTSVKLPGEKDVLYDPKEIEKRLKGAVDIVIDGGLLIGEPSTVISLVEDRVELLRRGKGEFIV